MAQDPYYHSKMQGREQSEEILDQSKTKTSWTNSKLCLSMSDVKARFRTPTSFSFVACNTFLPPGLVSLPVNNFSQQVSHDWHF